MPSPSTSPPLPCAAAALGPRPSPPPSPPPAHSPASFPPSRRASRTSPTHGTSRPPPARSSTAPEAVLHSPSPTPRCSLLPQRALPPSPRRQPPALLRATLLSLPTVLLPPLLSILPPSSHQPARRYPTAAAELPRRPQPPLAFPSPEPELSSLPAVLPSPPTPLPSAARTDASHADEPVATHTPVLPRLPHSILPPPAASRSPELLFPACSAPALSSPCSRTFLFVPCST